MKTSSEIVMFVVELLTIQKNGAAALNPQNTAPRPFLFPIVSVTAAM